MKKRTLMISAALLAALGTGAVVYAQGPRHFGGGHGPFGAEADGMGHHGGFRGRFVGDMSKDDHDAKSRERFARLDKNSDGFIDTSEFEAAMTERSGWMKQRMQDRGLRFGDRMIRMFDSNKDGKVSKEEHSAGIRKVFNEIDLNGDGKITDEDLPPMMRGRNVLAALEEQAGWGRASGSGMAFGHGLPGLRILMGADANKDGVVTLDEALANGEKRFAAADKTKDGAIDKADLEAMRKEMSDYRVRRAMHHFGAKDGKVSREQFAAKALERFTLMDLNGDGTVSRDEMPMGGRWQHGRGGMDHGHDGRGRGEHRGPGGAPGPR